LAARTHMKRASDRYSEFVEHPRYGRRPNITGLNPETEYGGSTFIHWHSPKECRIPNTAISADVNRQTAATVPVTHYYDVIRQCRDCGRSFIFFAQEQKHWYEDLGFGLDSNCVRCAACRKRQQGIARQRERYEELFHVPNKTTAETLEMADCCLSLIATGTFSSRQTERVRMLLNRLAESINAEVVARCDVIRTRLRSLEESGGEQGGALERR